jgi:hypothetical protein
LFCVQGKTAGGTPTPPNPASPGFNICVKRTHRFTVSYDMYSLRDLPNAFYYLIVISRRMLQFVALRFLVVDPQLRMIERNQIGHALHG